MLVVISRIQNIRCVLIVPTLMQYIRCVLSVISIMQHIRCVLAVNSRMCFVGYYPSVEISNILNEIEDMSTRFTDILRRLNYALEEEP